MFYIENFGSWILDTRRGLLFGLSVGLLSAWIVWKMMFGTVTFLSSRDFECAMAVPDGLGTKCIEYHAKKLK